MNKNKRKELAQAKLMEINPEMGMSWQEPVAFALQSNCSYPACVWSGEGGVQGVGSQKDQDETTS